MLCDTNGGTLPDQVERDRRRGTRARRRATHRGALPQRRRMRGGELARRGAPAGRPRCRAASTATASARATPTSRPTIPNLTLKMGVETIPRERLELVTPVAHHIAEIVNLTLDPQRPYVGVGRVRAQGRAAHERHRPSSRRLRAHPSRHRRQRHARRRERARRTLDARAEGRRARHRPRLRRLGRVLETLKHLEHAGYHFEVADGSLELLMRAAAGGASAGLDRFFSIESFRVIDRLAGRAGRSR